MPSWPLEILRPKLVPSAVPINAEALLNPKTMSVTPDWVASACSANAKLPVKVKPAGDIPEFAMVSDTIPAMASILPAPNALKSRATSPLAVWIEFVALTSEDTVKPVLLICTANCVTENERSLGTR